VNGAPLWLQAFVALLAVDLYQYLCRRGQHRFEVWWRLHKLHDAPEELTVLSTSRSHIADTMLRQVFGPGLLVYALGLSANAVIYGSLLPAVLLDALGHANIDFPRKRFRWLSYVFSLPNVHALHHTPTHDRVNFGMSLMIWDRFLGTFQMPDERPCQFGTSDRRFSELGILAQHLDAFHLRPGSSNALPSVERIRSGPPDAGPADATTDSI